MQNGRVGLCGKRINGDFSIKTKGAVRKLKHGEGIARATESSKKISLETSCSARLIRERSNRNPNRSIRKIAREIGTPQRAGMKIVHNHLGMSTRKKDKRQIIADAHRKNWKTVCGKLLKNSKMVGRKKCCFLMRKTFLLCLH